MHARVMRLHKLAGYLADLGLLALFVAIGYCLAIGMFTTSRMASRGQVHHHAKSVWDLSEKKPMAGPPTDWAGRGQGAMGWPWEKRVW